jgi:hypothetical protein
MVALYRTTNHHYSTMVALYSTTNRHYSTMVALYSTTNHHYSTMVALYSTTNRHYSTKVALYSTTNHHYSTMVALYSTTNHHYSTMITLYSTTNHHYSTMIALYYTNKTFTNFYQPTPGYLFRLTALLWWTNEFDQCVDGLASGDWIVWWRLIMNGFGLNRKRIKESVEQGCVLNACTSVCVVCACMCIWVSGFVVWWV